MDRLNRPIGRLLASIPLEQRAERYREFAVQAVLRAQEQTDPDRRAEYVAMAAGWHAMAVEAERYLGGAIPGEAVSPDQPEARPDDFP